MAKTRDYPFASRTSQIVLALTVATSFCAAVAAAPSASTVKGDISIAEPVKTVIGEDVKGMRPLGRGPAIKIGRAYGEDDEDCTLAVTTATDSSGKVHTARSVSCAN